MSDGIRREILAVSIDDKTMSSADVNAILVGVETSTSVRLLMIDKYEAFDKSILALLENIKRLEERLVKLEDRRA